MEKSGFTYKVFLLFAGLAGLQAYFFIFAVLFLCGMGLPIPEDITLVAAGYLAGKGKISFIGALFVGFVGVLSGDVILFLIGRKFGKEVFKWPVFKRVFTPKRIKKAEKEINQHAKLICFIARFMPGLRGPIYLTSGILKVPFKVFIFQDGLAATISVPVWIWLGYRFFMEIEKAFYYLAEIHILILIGMTLAVAYLLWVWWTAEGGANKEDPKSS